MKIQREVNGQVMEFELTQDELYEASEEYEHRLDLLNVKTKFDLELDPDDFEEEYGFPMDLVRDNLVLLMEMACLSRQYQDEDGLDWDCARDYAVNEVLEKYKDELIAAAKQKEQEVLEVKMYDGLPEMCYSTLQSTGELIVIERGKLGYHRSPKSSDYTHENHILADFYNSKLGVTKAQEMAMLAGSLFGWHVPAANPEMYDEKGMVKAKPSKFPLKDQIDAAEKKGLQRNNSAKTVLPVKDSRQEKGEER